MELNPEQRGELMSVIGDVYATADQTKYAVETIVRFFAVCFGKTVYLSATVINEKTYAYLFDNVSIDPLVVAEKLCSMEDLSTRTVRSVKTLRYVSVILMKTFQTFAEERLVGTGDMLTTQSECSSSESVVGGKNIDLLQLSGAMATKIAPVVKKMMGDFICDELPVHQIKDELDQKKLVQLTCLTLGKTIGEEMQLYLYDRMWGGLDERVVEKKISAEKVEIAAQMLVDLQKRASSVSASDGSSARK